MNDIQIFNNAEFGEVRTTEVDGKIYFCGKDCATALGYTNTAKALGDHCREDGVTNRYLIDSMGRKQQAKFISEGNLYRLIGHSKLPAAEKFERWVFDEVLPAIRKHGAYMTPDVIKKAILTPDFVVQLATELKREQEENKALTETVYAQNQQIDAQSQQIAELEPKGQYYDMILQTENIMTTTQIAKDYGFSAQLFNRVLKELGIIYPQNGTWVLYQKYANCGYGKSNTYSYWQGDKLNNVLTLVWTQRGRLFLYEQLKANGILPCIETDFSQQNFSSPIVLKCQHEASCKVPQYKGISRELLTAALQKHQTGEITSKEAAKTLGVSVQTYYNKVAKYKKFPDLLVY